MSTCSISSSGKTQELVHVGSVATGSDIVGMDRARSSINTVRYLLLEVW